MSKVKITVLLVHNHLSWHWITWLSWIIRVVTCSKWNHVALEITVGGQAWVMESVGKGVIRTEYEKWVTSGDRIVKPMSAPELYLEPVEVFRLLGKPYGFLDLLHIFRHLVRTRWLGKPARWSGKSRWEGYFCSELVGTLLGYHNPHLLVPADFEYRRELVWGEEYKTRKIA